MGGDHGGRTEIGQSVDHYGCDTSGKGGNMVRSLLQILNTDFIYNPFDSCLLNV